MFTARFKELLPRSGRSVWQAGQKLICLLLLAILGLIVAIAPAIANMANPITEGDLAGEPIGVFKNLHILDEQLAFDLRRLPDGQVTATYRIENRGPETPVQLVFVSPGIQSGSVQLDGEPLTAQTIPQPELPKTWTTQVPVSSQQVQGQQQFPPWQQDLSVADDVFKESKALQFSANLGAGVHELQVGYAVRATVDGSQLYNQYDIRYLLAPARSWASFGALTITVQILRGWQVAASLPLVQVGDQLQGEFTGLPADALALMIRPPISFWRRWGSRLLPGLGWAIAIAGSFWSGQTIARFARKRRLGARYIPALLIFLGPVYGLIWALVAIPAGLLLGFWLLEAAPRALSQTAHYSLTYALLLMTAGCFLINLFAVTSGCLAKWFTSKGLPAQAALPADANPTSDQSPRH